MKLQYYINMSSKMMDVLELRHNFEKDTIKACSGIKTDLKYIPRLALEGLKIGVRAPTFYFAKK